MKTMRNGEYFGHQDKKVEFAELTLTYTTYTHERVEWHRHDNPYFTFLLTGKMQEISGRGRQYCTPGTLLFHHSDEAHYNLKPRDLTRGFHIELRPDWLSRYPNRVGEGSYPVQDPHRKLIVFELFREFLNYEQGESVAIEFLVNSLLQDRPTPRPLLARRCPPAWVSTVRELIHDLPGTQWTLALLGESAGIHPNYLCRAFPTYFGCTLGRYLRAARVQHALSLMVSTDRHLSEIAYACGFADQSHFIRTFRTFYPDTPLTYRKVLGGAPG